MVEVERRVFFLSQKKVFLCLNYKTKLFDSILGLLSGNKGRVGDHLWNNRIRQWSHYSSDMRRDRFGSFCCLTWMKPWFPLLKLPGTQERVAVLLIIFTAAETGNLLFHFTWQHTSTWTICHPTANILCKGKEHQ